MKEFNNTAGATDKALAEQSKSLDFQLAILKNNATALGIELGNKLIPPITNLVKKLNDLSPQAKDTALNLTEIGLVTTGAVGGILILTGAIVKLRNAMITMNAGLASFAANGSLLARILPGLATGLQLVGANGIMAGGAFLQDSGILVNVTENLKDLKKELVGNFFENYF